MIVNAAKYGDPGTTITLRLAGSDDQVLLSIENAGPPIAVKGTDMLFEPLSRAAHGDAATERTSLGLGLFIVRQIVSAHGGKVSFWSADGKTVFDITLPKTPPAA